MQQLGSYFGTATIVQGAGGLGDAGLLAAYQDGVVGGNAANADMPGPLTAYHDGALGAGPLQAYADGVVGGSALDPEMPGPLRSFRDGSLGDADVADYSGETPISVYDDGIFGTSQGDGAFGPLQSYHDGSLGLGADASPTGVQGNTALDLGEQATMTELKSMMALLAPEQTLTVDGQKAFPPDWYTSGVWDASATMLWQYLLSKTAAFSGKVVSVEAGSAIYPNSTAIAFMIGTIAAPTASGFGPEYAKQNLPILTAWFTSGGGPVLAPFLSIADKTRALRAGTSSADMSTMALYGLGAVAVLGFAMVWRKKKKR